MLDSSPIIVIDAVVKQFGRFAALRGVSAEFAAGRLYAILGDNGAGKTTLLRTLAGLVQPTRGSVRFWGRQNCVRSATSWLHGPSVAAVRRDERHGKPALFWAALRIADDQRGAATMKAVGLDPLSCVR